MFRDAGFRILNDEPLEESHIEVVLDGYDPEKKVGYEYISASEARESISESEADELARHWSLLILRSCSLAHLRRGASEFLARVPRARDAGVAEP